MMRNCASENPYSRWWLWIPGPPLTPTRCALRRRRPGMTTEFEASFGIPAARSASGLCNSVAPEKQRAQGVPGAQPHPQSSWAEKENAHKSSGRAEIARHSLRNGFTAYSALSLGYRAF